jgi:hypothetical protein
MKQRPLDEFGLTSKQLDKSKKLGFYMSDYAEDEKLKRIRTYLKSISYEDITFKQWYGDSHYIVFPDATATRYVRSADDTMSITVVPDSTTINGKRYKLLPRIHFTAGVPKELRGLGLGLKVYKAAAKNFGPLYSNASASDDIIRAVYSTLIQDPEIIVVYQANTVAFAHKKTLSSREQIMDFYVRSIFTIDEYEQLPMQIGNFFNNVIVDDYITNSFGGDKMLRSITQKILNRLKSIDS